MDIIQTTWTRTWRMALYAGKKRISRHSVYFELAGRIKYRNTPALIKLDLNGI